jgi:hypothetical protein
MTIKMSSSIIEETTSPLLRQIELLMAQNTQRSKTWDEMERNFLQRIRDLEEKYEETLAKEKSSHTKYAETVILLFFY